MISVLVDTSVWIEHLRTPQENLISLISEHRVLTHSAIIGELACGHLLKRDSFLEDLSLLPKASEASAQESLILIKNKKLYGKGIGWVDAQLLASCLISKAELLTYDKKLQKVFLELS